MVVALAVVFGVVSLLHASSLDDAEALGVKAAKFVKARGKDIGIKEIGGPKGRFVEGDLHITITDFNAKSLAHPMQPKLVELAVDGSTVKDANGKYFMKEATELTKTKGSGWVSFTWTNPTTKKVQPGKYWVQRVEGMDMFTMCGLF
jgi:hypothetical protein